MRHGAADFIQKPAEPHKMLERVAAAVTASVELDVREHEVNRLKSLVGKLSLAKTMSPAVSRGGYAIKKSRANSGSKRQPSKCIGRTL